MCAEPAFDLVIDQSSDPLQRVHAEHGVTCSAIVTACNPRSARLSADENSARMRQLSRDLAEAGHLTIGGVAIDLPNTRIASAGPPNPTC